MNKKWKWRTFLLAFTIISTSSFTPSASAAPFAGKIIIDGTDMVFNAKPVTINGTLLVPFRSVFEELGLEVTWNNTTKMITGKSDSIQISLKADQKTATINGQPRSFNHAPFIDKKNNNLYVELRFISEATGASVQWNNAYKTATITTKKHNVPSSSSATTELARKDGIILSANKAAVNGVYKGMTVQTNNVKKLFDWVNVSNPSFYPAIATADVNNDGKKEIIVVLTKATGTEVNQQEIHVLDSNLKELSIEDPLEFIKNKVSSAITEENEQVNVLVEYNGKTVEKTYKSSDATLWFKNVHFGSIVNYKVENNKITATIPGQVSPTLFAVNVNAEYGKDLNIATVIIEKN